MPVQTSAGVRYMRGSTMRVSRPLYSDGGEAVARGVVDAHAVTRRGGDDIARGVGYGVGGDDLRSVGEQDACGGVDCRERAVDAADHDVAIRARAGIPWPELHGTARACRWGVGHGPLARLVHAAQGWYLRCPRPVPVTPALFRYPRSDV